MKVQLTDAQVVLFTEGFETNGEGTRYTSNTFSFCAGIPGNNPDYFLRTNTNPVLPAGCTIGFTDALTNLQGSFFWAGEDIRSSSPVPNGNPPGQITTQLINITSFVSLNVSLYLATSSNNNVRWETADSINIQASINGGPFNTVGRFMGDNIAGGRLRIDGNLDGAITGADPATVCDQLNFTRYNFAIPGTGTSLRVRLDFDQLGGTEELGIDQIQVTGVSTLPVKLLYFNASRQADQSIYLKWKTAAGSQAANFDIERSQDGIQFSLLRSVVAGNQDQFADTDHYPFVGTCYYRLKMTDVNGVITYSAVVVLQQRPIEFTIMAVWPNPVSDQATIVINAPMPVTGHISVWNMAGKKCMQLPIAVLNGQTVYHLPVQNLQEGFYILQVVDQRGTLVGKTKLLKQ
ncbi:MAG: T9SS type A sorting domain-containing protein [Bacteroidetes bacterium]|nr:T9SS type A sorting domain-containing protein [Bacteroidota bacterium]